MRRLILGTAGHIDHGKTALVKALTGVDTDRLKEEKERGITVDLGFAEYQPREDILFGVVDVPGHEGFIRNMLAGATGMDLVLLVVAADEGVMPQTREHLSIVQLLRVPRLVVAVTKSDLVDTDWLDLVREEVQELLQDTRYSGAPILPVSSLTGQGLAELGEALATVGLEAEEKGADDVVRLPIDRVFTIRGAGTVVTGTLWTGELREGTRVLVLPGNQEGRVRSLQVHGQEVREAKAGARVAVGLSGSKVGHQDLSRGQTMVEGSGWEVSRMLTCWLSLLSNTGWELKQGQRVRVHLGTAEVLARVALFQKDRLGGGEEAWAQLRLEEPVLARGRDHLVFRSYSPVTTLGGGRVAEVLPKKRRRLAPGEDLLLEDRLGDSCSASLSALLKMAGWAGAPLPSLPHLTGFSPAHLQETVAGLEEDKAVVRVDDRLFSGRIWGKGEERILSALEEFHGEHPLKPGIPLEELRQVLPGSFGPKLAEAVLQQLSARDQMVLKKGTACLAGFRPSLTQRQTSIRSQLQALLKEASLTPPSLRELGEALGNPAEVEGILRFMEEEGEVLNLDGEFFFGSEAVRDAGRAVIVGLAGLKDLGPADFREVLPVSRRHLLPLLRYFDLVGVTTRIGDGREVALGIPNGWGTQGGPGR
ncbi:MAG: selenocysteine-specific translation elongation factor [Gemmatimonadota bacterium]